MIPLEATPEQFRQAVAGPPDEVPLARAALLVARGEYPTIDVDAYERRLQDMAETLRQQLAHRGAAHPKATMQTVNQLMFRELGFRGNVDRYEDRRNLYLSDVLSERIGVPVTLSIVYAEVCQRAGLDVRPVGLPGHVICRYTPEDAQGEADELLLDVFNGGRLLTRQNCQELVRGAFGARVPFKEYYLANLLPRQVLQRLLHNLKAGALQRGDEERAARAIDFLLALFPWDLDEIRDRVRALYEFRKGDPPLLSGKELTMVLTVLSSLPIQEARGLLDQVLSEVRGRDTSSWKKGPRILIDTRS